MRAAANPLPLGCCLRVALPASTQHCLHTRCQSTGAAWKVVHASQSHTAAARPTRSSASTGSVARSLALRTSPHVRLPPGRQRGTALLVAALLPVPPLALAAAVVRAAAGAAAQVERCDGAPSTTLRDLWACRDLLSSPCAGRDMPSNTERSVLMLLWLPSECCVKMQGHDMSRIATCWAAAD